MRELGSAPGRCTSGCTVPGLVSQPPCWWDGDSGPWGLAVQKVVAQARNESGGAQDVGVLSPPLGTATVTTGRAVLPLPRILY